MSFMHMDATTAASSSLDIITLSGDNINAVGFFGYTWGWTFEADGNVEERRNSFTQPGPASDWIDPKTTFTAADYEVRGGYQFQNCSSFIFTYGNALVGSVGNMGSWYGLGIDRIFHFSISTPGDNEFCNGHIRYEIRNITNPNLNTLTSDVDAAPIIAVGQDAEAYYFQIEIGSE